MRTHIRAKPLWLGVAAVMATAAIMLGVAYQGNATAQSGPPDAPANPLAHLIVPDGEEPRIRVSWDAPDAEVSDYTITRTDGQTFSANGAATTFSDHTVEPGTTYAYSVAAHSADGASPASESASADVPDKPSAPGDLTGAIAEPESTDKTATVNLTWLASTVPAADQCDTAYPLTGYTVVRSDGDQETELGTADAGAMSFSDNTAAFSRQYTYRVTARNAIGASSSETAVTVFSQPVLPPTGLTAAIDDPFDGNVSLSWHAPTEGADIVGYSVHRYLGPDPSKGTDKPVILAGATLDELATQTLLVDATVEAGVTYSYLVIAYSAHNISEPSNTAAIEAPAAPSGLTATTGDGTIELSWSAPTGGTAVEYRVARQQTDGDWTTLVDTTDSSHSDDTAQPNVAYRYRVQHRNQYGGSTWTASEPVTLIAAPGQPTGLSASSEENDNILSWTVPKHSVIDGYRVRHRTGEGAPHTLAENITETSYRHADAAADVTHHYAVQAYNSAGNGPWSEPAQSIRVTPPGVPVNVNATLEDDDIVLTWGRPQSVHISGYTVRHQVGDQDEPTESELLPESQTSYRLADVAGDVTHYMGVKAHNDGGDSPWSDDVEITRVLLPSVPTSVSVAMGATNIVLSWAAPEVGTPDGYHVSYGEEASEERQTVSLATTETAFTHSDNTEGVAYRYRVRAHNSAGNGPWSDTLSATRLLTPDAPTDLSARAQASDIIVTWSPPTTGIVTAYEVEYGVSGTAETATVQMTADQGEFTHIGGQGDTEYAYRVRAHNDAGNGPWAGPATASWVIPPTKPTGVTAVIDGDDILVTWTAPNSTFINGYRVEHRPQNTADWTRADVPATQLSHRHTGPAAGATYEYRVRAHNAGGNSAWSDVATAVWHRGAAPPRLLIFRPFGARMLVRWSSSTSDGVTGYQLQQRIDDGDWTQHDVARYFLADWSADQSYHDYRMRALIDDQPGDWSAIQRATIATPTAIPTLTANRESTASVRLHWEEPASGTPNRYIIQGKWKDSDTYSNVSAAGGQVTTQRINMGHDSGYTFRVLAQNHVGILGPHQGGVTVTATIPEAEHQWDDIPRSLNISIRDGNTVSLTWYAPERTGHQVDSYRIYRKPISDTRTLGHSYQDHVLVPQTGSAATSYVDYTAEPGVTYEYGVAAYRDGFENPLSPISHRAYARTWE